MKSRPDAGGLEGRKRMFAVFGSAIGVGLVVVAVVIFIPAKGPVRVKSHSTGSTTAPMPKPPSVVVGTLVSNVHGELHYGDPVTPQGGWCSMGACWSTIVTPTGYVYPVRGLYGAMKWHIAGPALAGPGVSPRDHYLSVDSRSSTRAVVWTGRDSFASTYDGGHHWYRVTAITNVVAVGDAGARSVSLTIGLRQHACDYYFTYSSVAGTIWRRGGPLKSFVTTGIGPAVPSCLDNEHS